jgi:hypothetical protein
MALDWYRYQPVSYYWSSPQSTMGATAAIAIPSHPVCFVETSMVVLLLSRDLAGIGTWTADEVQSRPETACTAADT